MSDLLQNHQVNKVPEIAHEIEIVNLTNKLDGLVQDFTEGYKSLCQNAGLYLVNAKGELLDKDKLLQTVGSFTPLRRAQLQKLLQMSEILGVPLSPLGLVTFTSGELIQMDLQLETIGRVSEIGGTFIESSFFQSGPSSRAGLWLAQSNQAAEYTQAEIDKFDKENNQQDIVIPEPEVDEEGVMVVQGQPTPIINKKTLSPNKRDVKLLHEYQDHESFHGVHLPFTENMSSFDEFDSTLIREGLAARTALILKTATTEEIKTSLLDYYFAGRELTSSQLSHIDKFMGIISASLDPQYQREITWRGLCCRSLEEFFNPSQELNNLSSRLTKYSLEVALPKYRAGLGL